MSTIKAQGQIDHFETGNEVAVLRAQSAAMSATGSVTSSPVTGKGALSAGSSRMSAIGGALGGQDSTMFAVGIVGGPDPN